VDQHAGERLRPAGHGCDGTGEMPAWQAAPAAAVKDACPGLIDTQLMLCPELT
jgi:hypothetical protein